MPDQDAFIKEEAMLDERYRPPGRSVALAGFALAMTRTAIVLAAIASVLAASLVPARGQSPGARWSTLAPMPTPRQEISVSVLDGKVFAIAGYDANGQSTATVEVYDPRTNAWRKAASLPIATNHNAAATVNGRLYAFGGTSSRVFVYDAGA